MDDATAREDSPTTWSEYDARGGGEPDLASLPAAVRAIVEECRAQSKQTFTTAAAAAAAEGTGGTAEEEEAMPYPCRMYEEAVPGQEDMLQLQWMRVDVRGAQRMQCGACSTSRLEHSNSNPAVPAVYSSCVLTSCVLSKRRVCFDEQMSSMDSERCWGQTSQNEEHDCGPDSGLVLPMVYRLDPAEVSVRSERNLYSSEGVAHDRAFAVIGSK